MAVSTLEQRVNQTTHSHYVVLTGVYRNWFRGDVVQAEYLGDEIERLIRTKAIRPATEDESAFPRLTLSDAEETGRSLQERLVIRERELTSVRRELETVSAELAATRASMANSAASEAASRAPGVLQMLKDKDRVIADLQARLKVAESRPEHQKKA